MSHDVATHWLLRVHSVGHATTWVSCHLVRDEHRHIELLCNLLKSAHHAVQNLLTFGELTSARVVNSEWGHDRIDDQKGEAILNHTARSLHQEINQAVHSECATYHDVVEDTFRIEIKSVRNLLDALRSERVLGVDEKHFALATALRARKLCSDA